MEKITTIRFKHDYDESLSKAIDNFCYSIVNKCISLDVLDGISRTEWKNEAEHEVAI